MQENCHILKVLSNILQTYRKQKFRVKLILMEITRNFLVVKTTFQSTNRKL